MSAGTPTASRILAVLDSTLLSTDGTKLAAHLAHPAGPGRSRGVVLCHGFPTGPRGASASASTFPELADRIARETGCVTLTFNFRGTGTSDGDFSAAGWRADIDAAVSELIEREQTGRVWLVGVAEGGTFALTAAADDLRIGAVATLAAPRSLRDLAREPGRVAVYARRQGMISTAGFPESLQAWGRELLEIDGEAGARKLDGRPLLVLQGSTDTVVGEEDARALVAAAGSSGELRMVQAAGHELRHDPRAIAALLGWIDRLP